MAVVRFSGGSLEDLADIYKSMHDIGQVPVKVAFKDPNAIRGIPFPGFLHMVNGAGLPKGTIGIERNPNVKRGKPYSMFLVYDPFKRVYQF